MHNRPFSGALGTRPIPRCDDPWDGMEGRNRQRKSEMHRTLAHLRPGPARIQGLTVFSKFVSIEYRESKHGMNAVKWTVEKHKNSVLRPYAYLSQRWSHPAESEIINTESSRLRYKRNKRVGILNSDGIIHRTGRRFLQPFVTCWCWWDWEDGKEEKSNAGGNISHQVKHPIVYATILRVW